MTHGAAEGATDGGIPGAVRELVSHLLPGHGRHVRSFEEDAKQYGPLNRRPLGLRTVPLDRIVGSVGRSRELGANFQPAGGWSRGRRERYQRVYDALRRGAILPPVELYKLGFQYYVLDGNHRVAAMKEIAGDDGEVDAYVTQFLPVGDTEAARVFLERRAFEEATGLTQVGAVERGHYPALQREIEHYWAELAAETGGQRPFREAAGYWFITVWLPRAEQIRRSGLRRRWPEKRTADFYCFVREHRAAEAARRGQPLSWDEALADFTACSLSPASRRALDVGHLLHLPANLRLGRSSGPSLPRPDDSRDLEAHGA